MSEPKKWTEDGQKAREREAKVAQLARELFVAQAHGYRYPEPDFCFRWAEKFVDDAESRWEALK